MRLEGTIDIVKVRLVPPFDGIQRIVDGEMHHRHSPADDDGVLAAGGSRLEASNIPVEDLVGGGLVRNQGQQSENS